MKRYLIIPALNEEDNIPALFDALAEAVGASYFEAVVLVDNGSTDMTPRLAAGRGAVVLHEKSRGYGAACLAGLAWVEGRTVDGDQAVVAFLDADLADDPVFLVELCGLIEADAADLAIGSRTKLAERGALTPTQRFGGWLSTTLTSFLAGVRFTDLGPMRAATLMTLRRLRMSDTTWGWTIEMQFKAARAGLRCVEIDVPYRERNAGRSKISGSIVGSIRAGWKILWTIARLAVSRRVGDRDPA